MRVGLNYLAYNPGSKRGTLTYARGLLDGFLKLQSDLDFVVFVRKSFSSSFDFVRKNPKFTLVPVDDQFFKVKSAASKLLLASRKKSIYEAAQRFIYKDVVNSIERNCDLLYTPTTVLTFFPFKIPTILSMHDIQQVHFPHFFTKKELWTRDIIYNSSIKYTSFLQASSNFMKKDFLDHFGTLKANQVFVIPEGVNIQAFGARVDQDIKAKYKLPNEFLFYPAQLWPHKDHLTVLRALHELATKRGLRIPLVLTGAKYGAAEQIFKFIKDHQMSDVHYLGLIPFDDLRGLFQCAKFLITAVLYESSSLPILEAAASGCPVIASRTPPNLELGENLAINYFETGNSDDLARVLESVWNDDVLRKAQIEKNTTKIQLYDWKNIASCYNELFSKIAH